MYTPTDQLTTFFCGSGEISRVVITISAISLLSPDFLLPTVLPSTHLPEGRRAGIIEPEVEDELERDARRSIPDIVFFIYGLAKFWGWLRPRPCRKRGVCAFRGKNRGVVLMQSRNTINWVLWTYTSQLATSKAVRSDSLSSSVARPFRGSGDPVICRHMYDPQLAREALETARFWRS